MENKGKKIGLEHWQIMATCLMICDLISVCSAYFMALWLRFDCVYSQIPERYLSPYLKIVLPYAICAIAVFWCFHMYRGMWRFASYTELVRTFCGSTVASLIHTVAITLLYIRMPLSYYIWGAGS